jgi:Phage capsid family
MHQELRTQLQELDAKLRDKRTELARAKKIAEQAKASYAEHQESDGARHAAAAAVEGVKIVQQEIDDVQEEQVGLLKRVSEIESGRAGLTWPSANGWETAASTLDLGRGVLRADISAQSLLAPSPAPAPVPAPTSGSTPAPAPGPPSNRWLYPVFERQPFGAAAGDLVSTDFVINFQAPLSGVTGVEIPPATDTLKAELPISAGLATPTAKTFAIVADAIPAQLFGNQQALQAFLETEMARRLAEAYDDHVVTKIEAAAPPTGGSGANLVARIRRALATAHDLGSEPTHIALTPTDAASLDLTEDGGGGYVFEVKVASGGDGVWTLRVREAPAVSAPLLVSPAQLGISYTGGGTVLADPYSSMERNLVRVRAEAEGTFHIRNIIQGAMIVT